MIGGLGELLDPKGIARTLGDIYIYIFLEVDMLMPLDARALKCFDDHS